MHIRVFPYTYGGGRRLKAMLLRVLAGKEIEDGRRERKGRRELNLLGNSLPADVVIAWCSNNSSSNSRSSSNHDDNDDENDNNNNNNQ